VAYWAGAAYVVWNAGAAGKTVRNNADTAAPSAALWNDGNYVRIAPSTDLGNYTLTALGTEEAGDDADGGILFQLMLDLLTVMLMMGIRLLLLLVLLVLR